MDINIVGVSKTFGDFGALDNVSLSIPAGQLVALLGPSGSGKTTLLRIIAGLEAADEGVILFGSANITKKTASERQIGFVFQNYALFRHMSVFDNIAFGLNVRPRNMRPERQEIQKRVQNLLHLVKLEEFATRYPDQLSGGQRQRVALARALAVEPKVLLLDEPFGALDAKVRKELRRWLRILQTELGLTTILVTHDQEEAMDVADRIVILNQGHIEQDDTPERVYDEPNNLFVYNFLGDVNVFPGPVERHVRPHYIEIGRNQTAEFAIPACIRFLRTIGPIVYVEMFCEEISGSVTAEVSRAQCSALNLQLGDPVFLKLAHSQVFEPESRPCEF